MLQTIEQEIFNGETDKLQKSKQRSNEVPGRLKGKATIILQTRAGQSYFKGKLGKSPGVIQFSRSMVAIRNAASLDDPYADKIQLSVEKAFNATKKELLRRIFQYTKLLKLDEGIEVSLAASVKPLRIPLDFPTPYGFQAALLMCDYDRFARFVVTAKFMGLTLEKEAHILLRETGDLVRRIFKIPQRWHFTGVTRKDVIENNEVAKRAIALMGEINARILKSEIRARYAVASKSKIK